MNPDKIRNVLNMTVYDIGSGSYYHLLRCEGRL